MVEAGGFTAAVAKLFINKKVEINTGETRTTQMYADWTTEQKNVIVGVVVDVIGDGIVVDCNTPAGVSRILINGWSVISIKEWNPTIRLKDLYIDDDFRAHDR